MTSNARKLLEKARRSPSGWKRVKLDSLYAGYGFIVEPRSKHDVAYHPDYKAEGLLTMLPRSRTVNTAYVKQAVKLIDRLAELEAKKKVDKEGKENE